MTKIAILSDIHGNMDALQVVLDEAQALGVSRVFVCGDIAGYYYDTAAVWRALMSWEAVMCHGNHEAMLAEWIEGDDARRKELRTKYGSSHQISKENMPKEAIQALIRLAHPVPVEIDGLRFLLSHGTPWEEDAYIYPNMNAEDKERLFTYSDDYDVVLMGHTHYQFAYEHDGFLVLNPGSVGQPRSGKEDQTQSQARAQWALYDTQTRSHQLMTSFYDPSRIFEQADRYDPHLPYLKNVLMRREIAA